ncbi:MAG: stage 0 sporulation family protein [Clostridia bacterium]|nr:stage 0 sporulation family protein [Clostridia bacterium]
MYTPTERDEIAAEVHEVITEERLEALADAAVPKTAEETQTADTEGAAKTPVEIVGVRFKAAGKVYYFDPDHALYRENDEVIVETARGIEFGFVVTANRTVMASDIVSPLKKILRMANEEDRAHYEENNRRREEAFLICREKIQEHGIEMKLIDVEYTFDNNKLLFYFTADGRVDFRELVKDLASVFRTRIELRQIGIRDEAKLMGGLGVCGRPFCCHSFLSDFVQVSIKMAKEQNLSLNSAKISGTCGRLMCCLRYEYDVYEEEIRKTPKMDAVVETPDGEAVVCEVIPLAGLVRVKYFGNHADMPPKLFHRDDVRVKGKMNWKSGTVTYLDEQK